MSNETVYSIDGSVADTITSVLDGMKKSSESPAKLAESISMVQDSDKVWKAQLAELVKTTGATPAAKLEESKGMQSGFKEVTHNAIPLAVGGFTAIFATELVDGMAVRYKWTNNYMQAGVKLGAAALLWKFGDKIPGMGKLGKNVAAGLILFDCVRTAFPQFQNAAAGLATKVTGMVPNAGLAGAPLSMVQSQANQVASDYYSRAQGRRS